MVGTPFLAFYAIGITLQTNLPYPIKIAILVIGYIGIYFAGRYIFDDRLMNVLPMAVYLATKVSQTKIKNKHKCSTVFSDLFQRCLMTVNLGCALQSGGLRYRKFEVVTAQNPKKFSRNLLA